MALSAIATPSASTDFHCRPLGRMWSTWISRRARQHLWRDKLRWHPHSRRRHRHLRDIHSAARSHPLPLHRREQWSKSACRLGPGSGLWQHRRGVHGRRIRSVQARAHGQETSLDITNANACCLDSPRTRKAISTACRHTRAGRIAGWTIRVWAVERCSKLPPPASASRFQRKGRNTARRRRGS